MQTFLPPSASIFHTRPPFITVCTQSHPRFYFNPKAPPPHSLPAEISSINMIKSIFPLHFQTQTPTSNPNEHHRQDSILAASRERNRFRSINWEEYDPVHQKYLEIGNAHRTYFYSHSLYLPTCVGVCVCFNLQPSSLFPFLAPLAGMKPRMKNHFRAHQLSIWLRLIPELHKAGMEDVIARHNLFKNHDDMDLYEGLVKPDSFAGRLNYLEDNLKRRGMLTGGELGHALHANGRCFSTNFRTLSTVTALLLGSSETGPGNHIPVAGAMKLCMSHKPVQHGTVRRTQLIRPSSRVLNNV